ncbi:MAG TPA: 2,3,4,5-tetrahydropyridine-2,6-dicarboxylate N-succinyltransferase, partial [Myxococcota bacterium]|nr:2,3,4,5-tetrahydropyridine-2,6-dicarboxylate N-succinyltransferase [Myxococcota bacterium]
FRESRVVEMKDGFRDKELLLPRVLNGQVRVVPGGTSIRPGSFIGKDVVIMPPSFVNIGAFIDEATMIDSHVLVGSCAQIGKRVHLSTGVKIGGVLEPVGQRPVIVEDDCFIGAGSILTEGIVVEEGAVVASGLSLSASVPIYDTVNEKILFGHIPSRAVVVPGSRPYAPNPWTKKEHLGLNCGVIVKYRDQKTSAALILEEALRS